MLQFCTVFRSQYMHIYLVFSAFTSISTALLATTKASVFFLDSMNVCVYSNYHHHQRRLEVSISHYTSVTSRLLGPS
jgi:hypothetical protein